eukprot:CAMPEP_0113459834 /NCGR_PEP_ID=MMETSP0014_2-20120614/10669_1 /TAXON_ID=2857 /ORGANISM="Nitzschia sp." /LENGTH=292 /DNA_ID=CAMNT_0000351455 /DNA_START=88 /DNA_END=966 /DNA_ORIENTATION=+ /assembly_acc=CAM_ASM_000159
MFSAAFQRTATAAAKQNARAHSTVASAFGRAAAKSPASMAGRNGLVGGTFAKSLACQPCAPSYSTMHTCGPTCSHSCSGPNCASPLCNHKTTNVRQMSTDAHAMDTSTPAKCIEALEAGNARFVAGDIMAPNRNMDRLKELEGGQAPFAAFLSCADSRVPVEMVFDQGFGDLFICRIAGNIVNTETIGSLEFGCAVLGAKVLYVMGHSSCGAVNATMAGAAVPGVISSLYYGIKPGCDAAHGDLDTAIAENVKVQVSQLAVSPVLKDLVANGDLEIIGGVYDLTTGKVNRVC